MKKYKIILKGGREHMRELDFLKKAWEVIGGRGKVVVIRH